MPPAQPPDHPLFFIGSSLGDLSSFPPEVRREIGYALRQAQQGKKSSSAKPLRAEKAFKGASVLEIVEDDDGDTYRAVYTVKFEGVVYVLHAFQKKSTKGISTPKVDIDTVKRRLSSAKADYEKNVKKRDSA